jgi:hypothetical protein
MRMDIPSGEGFHLSTKVEAAGEVLDSISRALARRYRLQTAFFV